MQEVCLGARPGGSFRLYPPPPYTHLPLDPSLLSGSCPIVWSHRSSSPGVGRSTGRFRNASKVSRHSITIENPLCSLSGKTYQKLSNKHKQPSQGQCPLIAPSFSQFFGQDRSSLSPGPKVSILTATCSLET